MSASMPPRPDRARPRGPPREPPPVEARAGIDLSPGRHVGMPDHTLGRDPPARRPPASDIPARPSAAREKGSAPVLTSSIPMERGIDIAHLPHCPAPACQARRASSPAATRCPSSVDQVMRRDLRRRIAQAASGRASVRHGRVMQHDMSGWRPAPARPEKLGEGHGWAPVLKRLSGRPAAGTARDPSRRQSRHRPDRGPDGRARARRVRGTRSAPDRRRVARAFAR